MQDLTRGKPLKLILSIAVPLMLGNFVQLAYNWVDSIMVGKLIGNTALGAVGSTGAVYNFIIGFLLGIAEGVCILIARFFGGKDSSGLRKLVANSVYFCLSISIVLTVVSVIFNREILIFMRTPEELLDLTEEYQKIIYYGMSATLIYNLSAGMLRALGDAKSPLVFLIISAVLNIIFNYIFIVPLQMGVRGAGLGTVLAQLISGVMTTVFIFKKCPALIPKKVDLPLNFNLLKQISALSLPMATQYSVTALGGLFIQSSVNSLGSSAVLAYSIGEKLQGSTFSVMNCIGVAYANFASQNVGAKNISRVRDGMKSSAILNLSVSVVFGLVFVFFGKYISAIFTDGMTEELFSLLNTFYLIIGPFIPVLCIIAIFRNAIQGIGFGGTAMIAGLLELLGRILCATLLVKPFAFIGVCFASPLAWVLADLFLIPAYILVIKRLKTKFNSSKI